MNARSQEETGGEEEAGGEEETRGYVSRSGARDTRGIGGEKKRIDSNARMNCKD